MNKTAMNTHPTIEALWTRFAAWCDAAEADRLADEWIDSEMRRAGRPQ